MSTFTGPRVTDLLADFAYEATYDSLPDPVISMMKSSVLDQLGVQLYCAQMAPSVAVTQYVESWSSGPSTLVGSETKVSPEAAALANGVMGHGFELDDYHLPSLSHPGPAVVPAGIAVGEALGSSGEDLLVALAVGYEVQCRVGRGLSPSYVYDRGFHPQGVAGPLGAAVTAGKLIGLSRDQMRHAIALSCSHSSGTVEYSQSFGESTRLHAGLAASGGVRSGFLAERGFTGPQLPIEGKFGLAHAFAETSNLSIMVQDLGETYSLLYNAFKTRPYHGMVHASIDVVLEALEGQGVGVEDVAAVRLGVPAHMQRFLGGKPIDLIMDSSEEHSRTSLQFSLEVPLALAIAGGGDMDDLLRGPALTAPIREVAQNVTLYKDDECDAEYYGEGHRGPKIKVKAQVQCKDGRELRAENYARGTYENPLTHDELLRKFERLAVPSIGSAAAARSAAIVDNLEAETLLANLTACLVPAGSNAGLSA